MKKMIISLPLILAFIAPSPAVCARGDKEATTTTTTTTTQPKTTHKRKIRVKKKKVALPLPVRREPIVEKVALSQAAKGKQKARAREAIETEEQSASWHFLERTADYLRSPEGAENTARCFAVIGGGVLKARKEERKRYIAAGLVTNVHDAFRDSLVQEKNWGMRVRKVRHARLARTARRLDAEEVIDIAEEVTTGCLFPYLRHVVRKTDAEKIVDENKYIDESKLAVDIAKAIAGAIAIGAKDVLIDEAKDQAFQKMDDIKETFHDLAMDVVNEAKTKIGVGLDAAQKLVLKLTPDIVENAVADAHSQISSWLDSWDDDSDDVDDDVVDDMVSAPDDGDDEEPDQLIDAAFEDDTEEVDVAAAETEGEEEAESPPKSSVFDYVFFWR